MKPTYKTVFLVILVLIWGFFARPIYEFVWIALGRGKDSVTEKSNHGYAMPLNDVVALNSQLVKETEAYLSSYRSRGADDPLLEKIKGATTIEEYQKACEGLRAVLRQSFAVPEADIVQGNDFSAVEQKNLGSDELATYTALDIPVLSHAGTASIHCVGILIIPKSHGARMPLIVAAHGRGGMPTASASGKIPVLQAHNRDLALGAIRRGWAVFEPIFIFYGKDQPENIRDLLTIRAQEAGLSLPGIEFTKTERALDYLLSRPEFDASRVAMVGMSYGGFNTLYTSALDLRIRVSVVAAYFNNRADILDKSEPFGFFDWRFSQSLGFFKDPAVAALICPRPLQIQAGTQDQLFPIAGARTAAADASHYYGQLGLQKRFEFHEFIGRHDFDGEAAWTFIEKAFVK